MSVSSQWRGSNAEMVVFLEGKVAELERDLSQCKEALQVARAGQPIGPVVGAQTIVNQQHRIAELERQLAEEIKNKKQFERDWLEACNTIERMKPVVEAAIDSYATGSDTTLWRLVREYQKEE